MDLVEAKDYASVIGFTLRVSEGEMETLADVIAYVLRELNDEELFLMFSGDGGPEEQLGEPGEARPFLERMLGELLGMISENCYPQFLPQRFRKRE
jgi:hypothetical protein